MNEKEAKAVEQVYAHAERLGVPLRKHVKETRKITANNPVGFARNYANVLMGGENSDLFL